MYLSEIVFGGYRSKLFKVKLYSSLISYVQKIIKIRQVKFRLKINIDLCILIDLLLGKY